MAVPHSDDQYERPWRALAGWFLGPRAENRHQLSRMTSNVVNWYSDCREQYFPTDPGYFTDEVVQSPEYKGEIRDLETKLEELHNELCKSIPFFSTRYQGHMLWDVTMPSLLGYMSGLLWNQNNVDSTASPVTTAMEIEVGRQLCGLMEFKNEEADVESWGHITSCGSVANLEAMWSCRNLKFHPIAVKAAVTNKESLQKYPELKSAGNFPIYIPKLDSKKAIKDCSSWELLNMKIYDVCNLSVDMKKTLGEHGHVLDKAVDDYSLITKGFFQFMKVHNLQHNPVLTAPGSKHYSWDKSATVLGMGNEAVIPIEVDDYSRQNMTVLREQLQNCLDKHIPVLMVVAVIGSTEESAVDYLKEIIEMRDDFMGKGLNYPIHADAAWGGYFVTMIREPTNPRKVHKKDKGCSDFVPVIPLSEHAERQYHALSFADTITIDPHKSGFCPYPSGALLYRNTMMKSFITLKAPEVSHGEGEVSVGVYGLEGSKPGAAAAGVLLSHRVIGLDKMGYGRILGQCQLGSKLFYCLWMTVAEEFDNFDCVNFINLPPSGLEDYGSSITEIRKYIKKNILGKDDHDLAKDKKAMQFLRLVGPDALINTFSVNLRGSQDREMCNHIQSKIFNILNVGVGKSPKRKQMFVTSGTLTTEQYGVSMDQFKTRLGLIKKDKGELKFLRSTAMGPFQCSELYVTTLGSIFRKTCMNVIASLPTGDQPIRHTFVVTKTTKDGKVFMEYLPSFRTKEEQYHLVLTMKVENNPAIQCMREHMKKGNVFLKTVSPIQLFEFTQNDELTQRMDVMNKIDGEKPLKTAAFKIDEVFRFEHLEDPSNADHFQYPAQQQYFMYGDEKRVFISHVMTKNPDFHQICKLRERPHSVPLTFIDLGLIINLPEIEGRPKLVSGTITDPFDSNVYKAEYKGKQYAHCQTSITIKKKIWFDGKNVL